MRRKNCSVFLRLLISWRHLSVRRRKMLKMNFKLLILLLSLSYGSNLPQNRQNKQFTREDDTVLIEPSTDYTNYVVQSSPNCPDPLFGIPFITSEENGKCYLAGGKGPCPENMRLFPQQGSSYGFCDCNCDIYLENKYHSPRSYCTGRTDAGEIRSLAYVKWWRSCQPLLERSNCPAGDWLAFGNDPKKGPFCERAVCEGQEFDLTFYDKETRRCEQLDGKCRTFSSSRRGTRVTEGTYQLQDLDWVPVCVPTSDPEGDPAQGFGRPEEDIGSSIQPHNCPAGSRYSRITGKCQRRTYAGQGVG